MYTTLVLKTLQDSRQLNKNYTAEAIPKFCIQRTRILYEYVHRILQPLSPECVQ